MIKPVFAPLLAASLALSPMGAAPARADSDLGKVVAGIALLAIIGSALERQADAAPAPAPVYGRPPQHPGQGGQFRRELPAQCRETIREHGQDMTVYGKHCLKQNMRFADRLPQECERSIQIFGNNRSVYGAHCLRRYGWSV